MKKLFILTYFMAYMITCFGQTNSLIIQPNQEVKVAQTYNELTYKVLYEFTSYNYG